MNEFFRLLLGSFFLLLWFIVTLLFIGLVLPGALLFEAGAWDSWVEIKNDCLELIKGKRV